MRVIVLFNLKEDASPDAYEEWARTSDIPAVRAMAAVNDFRVLRTTGLLGTGEDAPYSYIETIEVSDVDPFLKEASTQAAQKIAAEFQEFADNPTFIMTESI
ncbi:MAG: REDY-like protein HapK [Erythrobacter sp.]